MSKYLIKLENFTTIGQADTRDQAAEFIQDWIEENGFGTPIALDIDLDDDGVDAVYIDPIHGMRIISTWKQAG